MTMLQRQGGRVVVRLPEEVDHHHTEEIRRQVDRIVREEPVTEVEFDFSETAFMDSAGIGMLIGRHQIMRAVGGRVTVSHMRSQIRRILELSGIQKYISLGEEESK
ncbi:MAG: STAS domain-containing protein [Eubacteriales bacterium]|nr:STAS domain-containing protein [Eubacteriales bacterium]